MVAPDHHKNKLDKSCYKACVNTWRMVFGEKIPPEALVECYDRCSG